MKRFWAAVIDYFLCCIICIVILGLIWDVFRTEIVWGYNFKRMYYLISDFVYFIYSVLFDSLCCGNTPGKDLAGYKLSVSEENMTVGWIVKHALCKTIAMRLSIPSAAYCITTGKMPYDRMLGIGCKDKISEIMEQKSKSVEDLKIRKRLVAIIIDQFIMSFLIVIPGLIGVKIIRSFYPSNNIKIIVGFLFVLMVVFMFLYYFISDLVTKGSGIGKKLAGIYLLSDGEKPDVITILKHSGLKLAAGCIWPISLVYLLVTGRMFYDEGLKLEVMLEQ